MTTDDIARLTSALDQVTDTSDATVWRPTEGETLVGELVTRDEVTSKFSEHPQPHLIVKTEPGDAVHVYASHAVLRTLIAKHNPQVGDRIAIRRLQNTPGKAYRNYTMVVEPLDIPF